MKLFSFALLIFSCLAYGQSYEWPPNGAGGIPVPNGAAGAVPYYISATVLGFVGPGTAGQCLISGGVGAPIWGSCVGSATGLTSLNAQTGSTQVFANDTNVIITSSNNTHTLGWASTLSMARGGSGASLTAANGDIVYSSASALALLPAGTSGQVLQSNGAAAPSWTTAAVTGANVHLSNLSAVDINAPLQTANNNSASPSNSMSILTGNNAGAGNSGNITVSSGTVSGGVRGQVKLDGSNIDLFNNFGAINPDYQPSSGSPSNSLAFTLNSDNNGSAFALLVGSTDTSNAAVQTADLYLQTGAQGGAASSSNTGTINILSGALQAGGSGQSGDIKAFTGSVDTGASGKFQAITGSSGTQSGNVELATGNSGTASGNITIDVGSAPSQGNVYVSPELRLRGSSSNYVGLKSPASPTAHTITLPSNAGASGGLMYWSGADILSNLVAGTSGQFLKSNGAGAPSWVVPSDTGITSLNGQTGVTQVFANDTNIIITSSNNTHTLGFAGTLSVARGGTGNGSFTAGSVIFSDGTMLTQDNANFFWDGTNFSLGIGTHPINSMIDVVNNSGTARPIQTTGYGGSVGFRGRFANGNISSPTAALNGNNLNFFSGRGYGSTGFAASSTGAINIVAGGTFTDSSMPTYINFMTTPVGSNSASEVMRVASTGDVLINTTTDNGVDKLQVSGSANFTTALGISSGGTNNGSLGPVLGGIVYTDATKLDTLAAGTAGQFLKSNGGAAPSWATPVDTGITSLNAQTGATQVFANDTNVIITSSNNTHTLGWASTLSLARGGSGASLTAIAGGSVYSTGSALAILAAGTSGQVLTSGGAGAPTWTTPTTGTVTNVTGSGNIASSGGATPNITFTGVLPIANGGTNNGSLGPVLGGVVYTNATQEVTLAAGTSGQVLTSQGGAAPIWQAPSATGITSLNAQTGATQVFANDTNIIITSSNNTHTLGFTGTLAVSRGGTGNSAFTSGSIPYSNGTILTQDNANLFWDGTNHRLGIGTSGPATTLDVRGIATINENANATAAQIQANTSSTAITAVPVLEVDNTHGGANTISALNFRAENATPSLTAAASIQAALSTTTGGSESGFLRLATRNAGTLTEWVRLTPTGDVGLGTTTPGAKLDIAGQFRTSGTVATIGTCGTAPSISGTNQAGTFTVGGGVTTACTISFSVTLANAPNACDISPANSTAAATGTTGAYVSSITTSAFVVTGLSLTGAAYYYQCF